MQLSQKQTNKQTKTNPIKRAEFEAEIASKKKQITFSRKESESHSVMSDSLWPHGLYSPQNSPGQDIKVGSHSLLQGIFPTQASNPGLPHCRQILYQLGHQGSPRILEWEAYPFSSGSSWPRNWTRVSYIAGGFFIIWATREAHQAPLSMEFSRQAYWSELPLPSPGDLPDPGIEPGSPALQADSLPLSHQGSPLAEKECGKLCSVIRNSSRQSITFHLRIPSMCTHICAHIHTCLPRHVIFKCLPNTMQLSYIHQIYINTCAFLSVTHGCGSWWSHNLQTGNHPKHSIQWWRNSGTYMHTHTHTHTHTHLLRKGKRKKQEAPSLVAQ